MAIQVYDLDTRELVTVDETTYMETFPQISDHYLVWSDYGGYEFVNIRWIDDKWIQGQEISLSSCFRK
ncbi:hypothetical protein QNH10_05970 [Sporosarcina thermotolerans]|uniref:hypothetical protein n=1 Tax=Sporosarcina thermotolerans TaxID=633404 RepID=UPI0024BC687E|nr:hypothetical protein [Sporosarcina thermotolerans]WHT49171.1 hypothetical protein QNH10_05970 [Sporosarcina thermotolerans]